jgi:hypothetical protein
MGRPPKLTPHQQREATKRRERIARRHWPQLQRQRATISSCHSHLFALGSMRCKPSSRVWPLRCRPPAPRTCGAGIRSSVRRAAASPRAGRHAGRVAGMRRCAGSRAIASA